MPTTEILYIYSTHFRQVAELRAGTNWTDAEQLLGITMQRITEVTDTAHHTFSPVHNQNIFIKTQQITIAHDNNAPQG